MECVGVFVMGVCRLLGRLVGSLWNASGMFLSFLLFYSIILSYNIVSDFDFTLYIKITKQPTSYRPISEATDTHP